jgi:F-type H+-transporting ATPase subunit epsilon
MYEKSFDLEIITPIRVVLSEAVTSVSVPGVQGGFQVLYNHAPLMAAIGIGQMKVRDTEGRDTRYATGGGFVEVKDNKVVVLVESAERADEIDVARAQAAKDRADHRLHMRSEEIDTDRARVAMLRALNRLRVAQHE